MAWQTLTASDVKASLSGPELTAFSAAALASGQKDPLPGIISQTVEEVRGYIAANASHALEAGETIPKKLVRAAAVLCRYRLITRLPLNSDALLEQRRREYEDALRLLEQVAAGRYAIEEPLVQDPTHKTARGRFGSGSAPVRF